MSVTATDRFPEARSLYLPAFRVKEVTLKRTPTNSYSHRNLATSVRQTKNILKLKSWWYNDDLTQRPSWPSVKVKHDERRKTRRDLLTGFLSQRTQKQLVVPSARLCGAEPANRKRDLVNKIMTPQGCCTYQEMCFGYFLTRKPPLDSDFCHEK
jgi:hypothetical protein